MTHRIRIPIFGSPQRRPIKWHQTQKKNKKKKTEMRVFLMQELVVSKYTFHPITCACVCVCLRAAGHRTAGTRPGCVGRALRWTAGSPGFPCTAGWSHGAAGRRDAQASFTQLFVLLQRVCVCACVLPWGRPAAAARCSSCTTACWSPRCPSHSEPDALLAAWWTAEGAQTFI